MILNHILLIIIYKIIVVVYVSSYNNTNCNISLFIFNGIQLYRLSTNESHYILDENDDTCFSVNINNSLKIIIVCNKTMFLININIVSEKKNVLNKAITITWQLSDIYGNSSCGTRKKIEC